MFMDQIRYAQEIWLRLLIFENLKKKGLPLTVVKPGTQSRRFTHINDTINVCMEAWKNKETRHYSISNKKVILY